MDAGCDRCGRRLAEGEDACPRCLHGGDIVGRCGLCDIGFPLCRRACPGCGHPANLEPQARLCEAQGYRQLAAGNLYRALRSFEALALVPGLEPRAWVGAAEVRIAGRQHERIRDELVRVLRSSTLSEPNQTIVYACVQMELPGTTAGPSEVLRVVWGTKAAIGAQPAEVARWAAAILSLFPRCVPARLAAAAAGHALGDEEMVARHLVEAFTLAPTEGIVRLALVMWLGTERAAHLAEERERDEPHDALAVAPIGRPQAPTHEPSSPVGPSSGVGPLDPPSREAALLTSVNEAERVARSWRLREGGSPSERREQRFRERLGPLFHTMEKAVLDPRTRAAGYIVEPSPDAAADEADGEAPVHGAPEPAPTIAEQVQGADAFADVGDLPAARSEIERALARDLDLPGGIERWRRWGAEIAERDLGRRALLARAGDAGETQRALVELARTLETSGLAPSAAVAWALAGDEAARLRLLGQPEVCDALARRLLALGDDCRDEGHRDGARAEAPGATATEVRETITAWIRDGQRRRALDEMRARLGDDEDPWLTEVAALLVALAVRGPRLDVVGDGTLRLALGARVTLGRRGATIPVAGLGVAPEHLALWRDEQGVQVAADTGTATGTTLAGARISAPLPVGASLLLHLAGRVEVRASTASDAGPLLVDVGDARYCVPLGAAYLDAHGEAARGADGACWQLALASGDDAPAVATRAGDAPWVVASAASPKGAADATPRTSLDLCFGDLLPCGAGLLPLEIRPPRAS